MHDPLVLRNLGWFTGAVHQIAADHDEAGMQPIEIRDDKLEIGRLLSEVLVFGEHPELWIGEHREKPRSLVRSVRRWRSYRARRDRQQDQPCQTRSKSS